MKIEYIQGDLFNTEIDTIAHGCNAQGVMGSGVAKIVRDQYKEAYDYYIEVAKLGSEKYNRILPLGSIIPCEANGKLIINAITQESYGRAKQRYVSYDAVAQAMNRIERRYGASSERSIGQIAMPQIGAGLGGGNWEVIAAIIEDELKTIKPFIYII